MKKATVSRLATLAVTCLLALPAWCKPYVASLIPGQPEGATRGLREICRATGRDFTLADSRRLAYVGEDFLPYYSYDAQAAAMTYSACTGEISIEYKGLGQELSPEQAAAAEKTWKNPAELTRVAEALRDKILPEAPLYGTVFKEVRGTVVRSENGRDVVRIPDANFAEFIFMEKAGEVWGPGGLVLGLEKQTGQVASVRYLPPQALNLDTRPQPAVEADTLKKYERVRSLDSWLLAREHYVRKSAEGIFHLDPESGAEVAGDGTPPPSEPGQLRILVNEVPLASNPYYMPVALEKSALINHQYFPSFGISVQQKADTILLRGSLPAVGRQVELTLNSKVALAGKEKVTLSAAPRLVNERLYLPYELLTLANGVGAKWDERNLTLSVETGNLGRPD